MEKHEHSQFVLNQEDVTETDRKIFKSSLLSTKKGRREFAGYRFYRRVGSNFRARNCQNPGFCPKNGIWLSFNPRTSHMPPTWGPHPRTKFERGTSRQTIRKSFQEHIPRFGKMNVVPNDPKSQKDGQTLVSQIEVNATSTHFPDLSESVWI